ncbi:MAG: DUF4956 domain-containing protein [Bacteroidetes bacterium]|nr:DUF4956 domain-containing protein [Bacteroidota bacterium]
MDFFNVELFTYNPDTPPFYRVFISALLAFFLSSVIAITYELTTKSIYKRAHFLQAIALIGIVAATIMQAIGDSVAIGLGMLGALSIIRFRTSMEDPRNITFIFASLGSGIAVGVFGFSIALVGTLVFCAAAIILSYTQLNNTNELIGELRLHVPKNDHIQDQIENILKSYCRNFELDQIRFLKPKKIDKVSDAGFQVVEIVSRDDLQEFTYLIRLKRSATIAALSAAMSTIEGLEELKLNFKKQPTRL